MPVTGTVFDIQRFAIHDGPGIRTTVFLKGCSNRCGWCHNPESLKIAPQLQYYPQRCVSCGACAAACPEGAHLFDKAHTIDRAKCRMCGACAAVCNTQALLITGKVRTVEDVMENVLADAMYYKTSGGGMTLSGGEPVLQSEFSTELLRQAKQNGIHTCMETAGNYPTSMVSPMLPYLDLILFDLKAWDEENYRRHIGGKKETILATLRFLDEAGIPLIVRTPVVGTVNDSAEEIEAIAKFAGSLQNIRQYQLIPYHALGKAKYDALGQAYETPYFTPPQEHMERLEDLASKYVRVFNLKRGFIGEEKK